MFNTAESMLPHLYGAAVLLIATQGVDAQGASAPCDLTKCMCAGVDLSSMMNKVYKAPQDAEGYAYSLSICGEIPKASLPSGCQQYAEHPSVVKVSTFPLSLCVCPPAHTSPRPAEQPSSVRRRGGRYSSSVPTLPHSPNRYRARRCSTRTITRRTASKSVRSDRAAKASAGWPPRRTLRRVESRWCTRTPTGAKTRSL